MAQTLCLMYLSLLHFNVVGGVVVVLEVSLAEGHTQPFHLVCFDPGEPFEPLCPLRALEAYFTPPFQNLNSLYVYTRACRKVRSFPSSSLHTGLGLMLYRVEGHSTRGLTTL